MGNAPVPTIKKEELDGLSAETHYDEKELKNMYKIFKKENQTATKFEDFKGLMVEVGVTDPVLQQLVFNVFDKDKEGKLTFANFVEGLSIVTRGDASEQLDYAFSLFDSKNQGFVTKTEMKAIMEPFLGLVGPVTTYSGKSHSTADSVVDEFFEAMDPDNTGKITREQYKRVALKNKSIIKALRLFS